jgi:putative transposase
VDEFTRECLALEVRPSFRAQEVIGVLPELVGRRVVPAHLRSDNGPEFVAKAVEAWLEARAIGALHIQPGSPWENAYVDSFNSRVRDEHLNREGFASLLEAQVPTAGWRQDYNEARPHSSPGHDIRHSGTPSHRGLPPRRRAQTHHHLRSAVRPVRPGAGLRHGVAGV